jgi:hypothetical protein
MRIRSLRVLGLLLGVVVGLVTAGAHAAGTDEPSRPLNLKLPPAPLRWAEAPATQPTAASQAGGKKLPPAPPPQAAKKVAPKGWWGRYTNFWDQELERIIDLDIWGVTAQLPKGYLTVKYQFNTREAVGRFDKDGKRVGRYDENGKLHSTIIPPIAFGDAASGKPCLDQKRFSDCLLAFDAGARGKGGSHELQISYGLTGRLDWYVAIPMQYHRVTFSPQVLAVDSYFATAAGISYPPLDATTTDTFMQFIERLGRPRPNNVADHTLVMGDVNTGFSWNFYRTKWLSSALTYRLYFPTAYVANPDNALTFFTGPDVDAGNHAFAMGAGLGHDFRLPRFIHKNIDMVLSFEWNFSYGFETHRKYPSVCPAVFDRFNSDGCRGFRPPEAGAAAIFDPQHSSFPDLSAMQAKGSTYSYTPGLAQDVAVTYSLNLWGVGLAVGLGQSWAQKPELDGDYNFLTMVNNLQMIAHSRATVVKTALTIPLFFLDVPATLMMQYQHDITGANFIYFRNNFYVTVQGYIPDAILLKRDRKR